MNKAEVRRIIETTLASGNKTPGMFDLPRMLALKGKLESCASIAEVVRMLEENRSHIFKAFGLNDASFKAGVEKLKKLE